MTENRENEHYIAVIQSLSEQVIELKERCRELSAENLVLKKELAGNILAEILLGDD